MTDCATKALVIATDIEGRSANLVFKADGPWQAFKLEFADAMPRFRPALLDELIITAEGYNLHFAPVHAVKGACDHADQIRNHPDWKHCPWCGAKAG